ncbi:MAG: endonuclease Q family protein, partial [candidate division WOR-3 bacterium]
MIDERRILIKYYADFHIHSKYSMATSKHMEIPFIAREAKSKGIDLMGTGDFTNPGWLYLLEKQLKETRRAGIYEFEGVDFILTAEVCNIYNEEGHTKKIHSLIMLPDFTAVKEFNKNIRKFGKLEADGRPTLTFSLRDLAENLFSVCEDAIFIPAHLWTPWFGLFGSQSGFDSIEEAFGNYSDKIYAVETGLSSDPPMNWLLSSLDKISLISNSDAHSPANIGREANCFTEAIDYPGLLDILKKQDTELFDYTVEFFPQEGKYHYDGHRKCDITFHPEESKKHNNLCPVCGRPLTLGVLHRVCELADRKEAEKSGRVGYKRLIPLREIIANSLGLGTKSRLVEDTYRKLTTYFGNEFRILIELPEKDLTAFTD